MMSLFVTHGCQILYLSIQVRHSSYRVTGDGCLSQEILWSPISAIEVSQSTISAFLECFIMDLPTLTFNLGTHACICNLFICRVLSTHSHAYFHFGCFLMHIMLGHFKTNTSQARPTCGTLMFTTAVHLTVVHSLQVMQTRRFCRSQHLFAYGASIAQIYILLS